MEFIYSIPPLAFAIFTAEIILAAITIVWSARRTTIVTKCAKSHAPQSDHSALPPVSVIVYTCNDTENLAQFIPAVMKQDYPQFEVVIVNAGTSEMTKDLLMQQAIVYHNLYHTFIPKNTENLSRKKLALMLGIKAAKHPIVLLTASNAMPQSDKWLRTMCSRFNTDNDIVIGYSHINHTDDKTIGNRMRQYDTVADATQYLSYALRGHTYRADGNNLAYRKHLFFDNKGFHSSLNLHYGDDDLFISEIASEASVAVCLEHDAQLIVKTDDPEELHRELKMRYGFTARYLDTWAMHSSAIISAILWILPAAPVANFLIAGTTPAAATLVPLIAVWTTQAILSRKACTALQSRKITLMAPLLALYRPLYNLRYKLLIKKDKKSNFTWQRKKVK